MEEEDAWLADIRSVHVLGAGLRQDRPAHQAFHDAGHLGYRMVPIHPKDAGNTLLGRPIRPHPWIDDEPELFVLFLSPERVMGQLRSWLLEGRSIPFIWLQPGAESGDVVEFLESANIGHSVGRCWVVTVRDGNIHCSDSLEEQKWYLQTTSLDGSECSIWRTFDFGTQHSLTEPLEWVGDHLDLSRSNETIPRYIRSLTGVDESLEDAAIRLAN